MIRWSIRLSLLVACALAAVCLPACETGSYGTHGYTERVGDARAGHSGVNVSTDWRGQVGWNDNHVDFLSSAVLQDELWIIARPEAPVADDAARRDTPGSGAMVTELRNADGAVEQVPIPLRHTDVKVSIVGYLSAVDVTQQFHNPYESKIEAVYLFPLPSDAAVNEFVMTIGDRRIRGVIRERAEAERIYSEARSQGYVASLLTQERPNIFAQKVANIEPGRQIDVHIRYYHTLAYDEGWYEFVFPMVVGPRYNPSSIGNQGIGAAAWGKPGTSGQKTELQYLRPNQRSGHDIALAVNLDAGVAIEELSSPSHRILTANRNGSDRPHTMTVQLAEDDTIPNKDFVLRYRVVDDAVRSNFIAHRDDRGGYFTMVLYPPADLRTISREPMELVFLIDCSGSMSGAPIAQVRKAILAALGQLRPSDSFQIIGFSNQPTAMADRPLAATASNIRQAEQWVRRIQAEGGTEMLRGMQAAIGRDPSGDRRRLITLMTDGYVGNEREIIAEVASAGDDLRFFSFGVGSSPNRYLMEGVARAGQGAVGYFDHKQDPTGIVRQYMERISHPAMTDVSIDFAGMKVSEVYPRRIPDLYVGRPIVITGRFEGQPRGSIRVNGRAGGLNVSHAISTEDAFTARVPKATAARALPQIWARAKIADLVDHATLQGGPDQDTIARVRQLAIDYQILSDFTAFVAVDASRRTEGASGTTVGVPVPVPAGVPYETTVIE